MSAMKENNIEDNSVNDTGGNAEGVSLGRCPVGEQRRPGRHQVSAKVRWTKRMNIAVMECYYRSNPVDENGKSLRGYRRRMFNIWKERGIIELTEQRLCDQARAIRINQWLTPVELEEIKRRTTNVENEHINDNQINEVTRMSEEDQIQEDMHIEIEEINERNEEDGGIIEAIIDILKREEFNEDMKGFKKIDRKTLNDTTRKVNRVLKDITTKNITDTNRLIKAASTYIGQTLGLKGKHGKRNNEKEPWWKRRIKTSISEIRKHINILERQKKGEIKKKEKFRDLEKRYKIKRKGINVVIEELKQRLDAKTAKIRRYDQRIQQYRINRMFEQDQRKVYQEMNGKVGNRDVKPDAEKSKEFWSAIWGKEKQHKKDAEWLEELKKERGGLKQENISITEALVKQQCKKMPNWKSPGPDGVQGFWIKKFTTLHKRIADQMDDMINNRVEIPKWMTIGKTVLIQKDGSKGNAVENFRPISCLPLMWKLMTGMIAEKVYEFLDTNDILPVEQKGCRRKSRGTKDQLLIDKMILQDCRRRHTNLAMAWVDYKKAYDMVPHSWIMECLKLVQVSDNVIDFIEKSMKKWQTELTSYGEILGKVNMRRGIFQGDSLSPLLFVICMIPITSVLRKVRAGYVLRGGEVKVNHLLFMDDLKLFGKNEGETNGLVSTVQMISKDIGMEFGIKKCGMLVMKRGKLSTTDGIELAGGEKIREVDEEGYKYLGILELDKIKEKEMKELFRMEYLRRVRLVMKSRLNGRNKIGAINTWAVSLMRYGAGVIRWNKEELEMLDRKTRKIMTINKELHPRSDVTRLYVARKRGGRGLIGCESCVQSEENSLGWYVKNSEELMLKAVKWQGIIHTDVAMKPEEFKKDRKMERESRWMNKKMHGQYVREMKEIDEEKTWRWLNKGDLKGCTEALICSAQEQALRTNYVKFHIDKSIDSPLCRMCGAKSESVGHLVSECSKLAQKEYKRRHDNVARYIHWKLCEQVDLEKVSKWYEHQPERVIENGRYKILWDFNIQCDNVVEARRPDIVVVDKKGKEVKIIDVAIPGDSRVRSKEQEKIEKYQLLRDEMMRMWGMKKVVVIPVVIGALGAISIEFENHVKKLKLEIRIEHVQKTALLGTARILRKVLSL